MIDTNKPIINPELAKALNAVAGNSISEKRNQVGFLAETF
jgi:hypothetical protein